MDLSKAFDMVEWGELFSTMVKRGVHPIFLRVLLFVYKNQKCDVKWAGKYSHRFSVSNGVRQGAVSSPLLFSIYIDDLLKILRKSGLGCHISNIFFPMKHFYFLNAVNLNNIQQLHINPIHPFHPQPCPHVTPSHPAPLNPP